MDQQIREIIADLKSFLEYVKGTGIESLPCSSKESRSGQSSVLASVPASVPPSAPASVPAAVPEAVSGLKEIRNDLGNCRRCKLHRTRRTIVFGEGNEKAKLMFIGEGPGYDEDVQGRPFVGRAGQLLTKIILSMGLQREDVYIANIVKCRPPQNRNPEPDEIESCTPFLLRQIAMIQPRIICALGTFSAQTLLKTATKITALRGRIFEMGATKVIPTYHPAFLLRNPEKKKEVWEDMKRILEFLQEEEG
jgi:uracil-DNA glycosylase